MSTGPWRKSNKRMEKRNFSTSYVRGGHQSTPRFAGKAKKSEVSVDENKGQSTFDPVQSDRFFFIPSESEHWPPNEAVRKRLESDSLKMATFDKKIVPKKEPNIAGGSADRVRQGELRTPGNVNLSERRTVFSDVC
ncbi:hypothetical protein XU18_1748 [Perkinsela sp. CCAP 1560/4]|nr:hypothetical protein XU18_2929 [Perkinsela sp. CCAP 1560/4]KNH07654.1 hypothetical protein XU18_1748 [Perkinsela sp. CCAP 1560/4]|eukprot:KNH06173.1 hypothetical protein XU18_2929 [Perkinsela sp. CCAP 1560/4]